MLIYINRIDLPNHPQLGKKKLKAVSHAVRNVNRTPRTPRFRHGSPSPNDNTATYFGGPRTPENVRGIPGSASVPLELQVDKQRRDHAKSGYSIPARRDYATNPESEPLFREGLDSVRNGVSKLTRYGSILGTPPSGPSDHPSQRPPSLKLPGPALSSRGGLAKENRSEEAGVSAYEAGTTKSPSADKTTFQFWKGNIFGPEMGISRTGTERSRLRRLLSFSGDSPSPGTIDYPMDGYREIESRQSEFFGFLDSELDKIESFYRLKEDEATERLYILRDQLHILRDKRLDEIVKSRPGNGQSGDVPADQRNGANRTSWLAAVDHAFDATFNGRVGKKTQAMATMTTPDRLRARDDHRDYVRRATDAHIPYRSAKRKLKLAIQEFYRALELLKSYALLNRIAFRKLTKKYDKNLNVRPKGRYMSEKVNKAWFVESDVLDGHINAVEDLYARYFEGGNHKLAAGKLKKHIQKKDYHGGALFRIGLFLAAGAVFGVQGLVAGTRTPIDGPSSVIATQTSYLLQVSNAPKERASR
jgi:xenotropic and polytropic retrovirus receptor 1